MLVGHSYGGALVSELADNAGVKSLVYAVVAAQRPVAAAAFGEPIVRTAPAALPKYAVVPTGDHAIAPATR